MICYICKSINNYYSRCIPAISTTTPSAVPTARPSSVEERRKLFNYPAGIRSTSFHPTSSTQRASLSRKGKSKKIQTCTIKIFWLNNVFSKLPPMQIVEKAALANSDLGTGTIVFDAYGNLSHFHQKIMFPALQAGGGYELLLYQTRGLEKGFHKIAPPYTHGRVKEVASHAQVYIRPLQRDLQLKALPVDASSHDEVFSNKHIFL